ncbi:hypothetical protein [Azospirillum picis]|uniref:N-acetyltransferase domain-containing protein n=1 Tax=Azospirillum picis TaxID=488438 RepID=A0ABU0MV18_9PROT|nr:hypothetical protein [Azospirillum picis]MBP2303291.1 hypothetical protein [Azospirillum picis]MDQ0537169.1 hypothetical protein [Azospirillum picis]
MTVVITRALSDDAGINAGTLPACVPHAFAALQNRLESKGVRLFLSSDWGGLERVNARNVNAWFPLLPHPHSAPAHWIGAVDSSGDIVATQGAILLDCTAKSFGERLGDLSAFHDLGTAPPDEWCFCASEAAFDTRGRTAFVTSGWVAPHWRGRGLFHPMATLMRLACLSLWDVHWWAGLVEEETVPVWNAAGAGRRRLEPRPTILYQQSGVARCPLHLLRFSRAGVLLDAGVTVERARLTA